VTSGILNNSAQRSWFRRGPFNLPLKKPCLAFNINNFHIISHDQKVDQPNEGVGAQIVLDVNAGASTLT